MRGTFRIVEIATDARESSEITPLEIFVVLKTESRDKTLNLIVSSVMSARVASSLISPRNVIVESVASDKTVPSFPLVNSEFSNTTLTLHRSRVVSKIDLMSLSLK